MSNFAKGSSTRISYVAEGQWGTTPTLPTLKSLPVTSFSLNLAREDYADNSITGDRMKRFAISGTRSASGTLAANLSAKNFDTLLASAMNGAWTADVLKTGDTRTSLTVEEGHAAINQYFASTGVIVDQLTLNVPSNGIVTLEATLLGKDQAAPVTSPIGAAYEEAEDTEPMSHIGGTASIGGVANTVLTSISLQIQNNNEAAMVIGAETAVEMTTGMSVITGTAQAYFPNATEFNRFRTGTATSFEFTVQDTQGNSLKVTLPRVRYTGANRTISENGPVLIEIQFEALKDAAEGTNLKFTRTYA
jgi:hypothetical protein